ncbi:carboxypeptidase-like regulatory domain-containing protein [Salegentibacter mishustinae]|uniref:carboxypeptidase-like regulatory domain-containing protein n=1 Tax=Salegentibacter mishustinae TaxID=270918 RepID=UPI001CE09D59|nr:carboxypeptidase-like regulatory domain-containing protein [Salegentibacter mishustinae]UBZ08185.1 carboxypeptidase-like regulatory domain-containing protein [Salegentibacter mishustinae]
MKKVVLLFSLVLLVSCFDHSVSVVGDKRMQVSGNILDTQNTPLGNINVIASGSESTIINAWPEEILGEGFTNASGEFSFVSLDTDNSFYGVSINHPNHQDYREEFSTIHYLDSIGSRGNSFELTNIQLPKILEFQVKLNNTSARNDTLFFEFSYSSTEIYRKLQEDSFDNSLRFQGESEYWNKILPGEDEMTISAKTIENNDLQFKYKFSAEAVYNTINVEITPENSVYEFSY